jgi:hypothetical protein
MTEFITNGFQITVAAICAAVSLIRGAGLKSRSYILLTLFFGTFLLGDLYWLLFYLFYSKTPNPSFIPDLSWYSSYLFLIILLVRTKDRKAGEKHSVLLFAAPLFTVAMCLFFMQYGEYLSNIVIALLMGLIIWHALDGLLLSFKGSMSPAFRPLFILALVFCGLEYLLWVSSCIWESETFANPYYWIDILLSCTFFLFVAAVGRILKAKEDCGKEVNA